ncbi:MAG: translation elongation factor 4 [Patescibacteria group bacterium]
MSQQKIRNFCVIAHVDHGKSTLADRFLEITKTVDKRHLMAQTLDSMELEREKGITIKLKAVRMEYNGYQLNLIDTPGHVDFSYEVSRSLAACEGAVLVVDATQGIQAQTVSNIYKAMEAGLTIIPVLNKVDLINAEVDKIAADLEKTFGFKKEEILVVSAKTGQGVAELLEKIVQKVPAPKGSAQKTSRALVFDNYYNEHLGVVALIKVVDGSFDSKDLAQKRKIKFLATGMQSQPEELGILKPQRVKCSTLQTGEVGYIATGLKDIHKVKVGDTLCWANESPEFLPGYKEVKPFVFVSIFPVENDKFPQLRDALEKLSLSDSALTFEPESSSALGFGFRCGFLGLLHADIVQERLEREYNLSLISTIPTVEYKVFINSGEVMSIKAASDFPEITKINRVEEPWILITIVSPSTYTGGIITLCQNRRAILRKMDYPTEVRVVFEYELPLAELIQNFFDELKTVSSGFASVDYEFLDYKPVDAIKMDILIHGTPVSPLSQIVLKEKAVEIGQKMLLRLKEVIPRQQFEVALQATLGGKIIARENIPAMRKNVLAKMSGGHRERKDKLLDIQKKGKARMKRIGKVDIPQEAFRQILT